MNSLAGLRFALLLTVWAASWPAAPAAQTTSVLPSPLSLALDVESPNSWNGSGDNHLRHTEFVGLREDKSSRDVKRDLPPDTNAGEPL